MTDMEPPPIRVQLYIAARDRPELLRQTLESAIAQDAVGLEIIVSDNSEGDSVGKLVAREFPQVRYIRRYPTMSSADHASTSMGEATAEFSVYFHDDDVMEPHFVSTQMRALEENPDVVAVGCNAWTLRGDQRLWQRRMGPFRKPLKIRTPEELLPTYLDFSPILLAPPTPGYLFRSERIKGLRPDAADGGKYNDVAFYMKLLKRGAILWLPEPLMWYREHEANDSVFEAVGDRLRLLRYVYAHSTINRNSRMVTVYRFRYWLSWWKTGRSASHPQPWREAIVRRFLVVSALKLVLTHPGLWRKMLAKLIRPLHTIGIVPNTVGERRRHR